MPTEEAAQLHCRANPAYLAGALHEAKAALKRNCKIHTFLKLRVVT